MLDAEELTIGFRDKDVVTEEPPSENCGVDVLVVLEGIEPKHQKKLE